MFKRFFQRRDDQNTTSAREPARAAQRAACVVESMESRVLFDGTMSAAKDLGELYRPVFQQDSVSYAHDRLDYRKFTLPSRSTFAARLENFGGIRDPLRQTGMLLPRCEADLYVLNAGGWVVGQSTRAGSADTVNLTLEAGTYYVQVRSVSDYTQYRLTLGADTAGDTVRSARPVKFLGVQTATEYLGDADPFDAVDTYRLDVTQRATVRVLLTNLNYDYDLELVADINGDGLLNQTDFSNANTFTKSTNSGRADERMELAVTARPWFLRVVRREGSGDYRLDVTSFIIPDEAGNTMETAMEIGLLSSRQLPIYDAYVGVNDDPVDFFRVDLDGCRNIRVEMWGLANDADIELLDSRGNVLAYSENYGTTAEVTPEISAEGTVYIRVYAFEGATNYNLRITVW